MDASRADADYALDTDDNRVYAGDRVRFLGDCEGSASDGVVDRLNYEPYAGPVWTADGLREHFGLIDDGLYVLFDDGEMHHVYANDIRLIAV